MRTLLVAISICIVAATAGAEPYAASGQVGYLQEWELKANLAKTVSGSKIEYSGPVTLRHVGLCSANGVEEKSGNMRLTMSRAPAAAEGTLALEGDSCRIVANQAPSYSGLLTCRNGQGVPISFSIEEAAASGTTAAGATAPGATPASKVPGSGK
jgi:hypothetical protein